MKKIALVLSGIPRYYKLTNNSLFKSLQIDANSETCKFDLFLNIVLPQNDNLDVKYPHCNVDYDVNDILKTYDPKAYLVQKKAHEVPKPLQNFTHCFQQIKNIELAMGLAYQYATSNNFSYDIVVRARFDMIFFKDTDFLRYDDRNRFYGEYRVDRIEFQKNKTAENIKNFNACDDAINQMSFLSDLFFFGSMDTMKFTKEYTRYLAEFNDISAQNNLSQLKGICPEHLLLLTLAHLSIENKMIGTRNAYPHTMHAGEHLRALYKKKTVEFVKNHVNPDGSCSENASDEDKEFYDFFANNYLSIS